MDLPIKFPSESEVILKDVATFRALPPLERIQMIRGMLADGERILEISPKRDWARQYDEEQQELVQRRVKEFIARHGR